MERPSIRTAKQTNILLRTSPSSIDSQPLIQGSYAKVWRELRPLEPSCQGARW